MTTNLRLTLCALLLALAPAVWAGQVFHNFSGRVKAQPTGAGTVYMQQAPAPDSKAAPRSYQATMKGVVKPIESRFRFNGPSATGCITTPSDIDKVKMFSVFYPMSMASNADRYPLVIMVNGTGVPATAYKAMFEHLASWGFIVAGNEDEGSGTGRTTEETLKYMLAENERAASPFYHRIDTDNIGVAGHSQGGAGTYNALTAWPNSYRYKAGVAMSPSHKDLAASPLLNCPFDVSKVSVPVLITASTGTEGMHDPIIDDTQNRICDITDMISQMNDIHAAHPDVPVVIGRLSDHTRSHGDNLMESGPYLAAWFSYWLRGDQEAGEAFFGTQPEMSVNPRWQDVQSVGPNAGTVALLCDSLESRLQKYDIMGRPVDDNYRGIVISRFQKSIVI